MRRPSRWNLWLLAFAAVGVGTYAGVRFLPKQTHRFDQAAFDRIQLGMTRAQVESVLGSPPGDYRPQEDLKGKPPTLTIPLFRDPSKSEWIMEDVLIEV